MPPDQFTTLRKLAMEKRDRVISAARSEYASTMTALATMEERLLEKRSKPSHKSASICAVLPRNMEFTCPDMLAILEAADDGRIWTKKTVTNLIDKLRRRGLIRRTKRASVGSPAVYVRTDSLDRPLQISELPLAKAVQTVLTRPMNLAELSVAVLEAGYTTRQSGPEFRHSVGKVLRQGGFRRLARGRWEPVGNQNH